MNAWKKQFLGCRVTDMGTGREIGRVKSILFDNAGLAPVSILVQGRTAEPVGAAERLVGRLLLDANRDYLGEIVDLALDPASGALKGVFAEAEGGQVAYYSAPDGLHWEQERWVLEGIRPRPQAGTAAARSEVPAEADDWMIGRVATSRLTDRHGRLIVERGERITLATIEQANRAGVLHQLEADLPER